MYKQAIFALEQRLIILNHRGSVLPKLVVFDKNMQHFIDNNVQEIKSIEAALEVLKQKQALK